MNKCASDIYGKIVSAKVGDLIGTRHANGKSYPQLIEDTLEAQGYKKGVSYDTEYDWKTHQIIIKKLSAIQPYKAPKHDIKVGDIFYNSWGYEQTNIDYYQVVATMEKTISIKRIKGYSVDYDGQQMTGKKAAVKDSFINDEIIKKTPFYFMGRWRISFEYGAGGQWDGVPMDYSCYA